MGLMDKLKGYVEDAVEQEEKRWRIKKIPSSDLSIWEQQKLMAVKTSFYSLSISLTGIAMFFAYIIFSPGIALAFELPIAVPILIGVFSFAVDIFGALIGNHATFDDWYYVDAKLIDHEIQEPRRRSSGGSTYYNCDFRLLCEYEKDGETITLIPQPKTLFNFRSIKAVETWLAKQIDSYNRCKILIHPDYPQLGVIGYRKKRFPLIAKAMALSFLIMLCLGLQVTHNKGFLKIGSTESHKKVASHTGYDTQKIQKEFEKQIALMETAIRTKLPTNFKEKMKHPKLHGALIIRHLDQGGSNIKPLIPQSEEFTDFLKTVRANIQYHKVQYPSADLIEDKWITYTVTKKIKNRFVSYRLILKK